MTQTVASQSCVPPTLGPFINVWQLQLHVLLGDEVAADVNKVSDVSPVAHRTRAKTAQRNPCMTPTPASRVKDPSIAKQAAGPSLESIDTHSEAGDSMIIQEQECTSEGTAERLGTLSDDNSEGEQGMWSSIRHPISDYGAVENTNPFVLKELATADVNPAEGFYTPARDPKGQLIKDEQTVNVFLLSLLSAITATTVPFGTRWLAERNAMVFEKNVRYVARTDGHLCNRRGPSFSLIEVKPRKRADNVAIRVQESAQMAAWISHNGITSHNPDMDCKIFLLSQDKDELFVTFPIFSKDYGKNKDMSDAKEANLLHKSRQ